MVDPVHVFAPAAVALMPMLAGILKRHLRSGTAKAAVRILAPTVAALSSTLMLDVLFVNTKQVTELAATSDIWYILGLVAFTIGVGYLFFRTVKIGSKIADLERVGVQKDLKNGVNRACEAIDPMLESFRENMGTSIRQDVSAYLAGQRSAIADLGKKLEGYASTLGKLANTVSSLTEVINGFHDTMDKVAEYFAKNPDAYRELIARIEAIKDMQQPDDEEKPEESRQKVGETGKQGKDGFADGTAPATATKITTQGGRANHEAGHKQQDEMGQLLRDKGFDVKVGHGIGEPDFIIRLRKNGVTTNVAAIANKFYSLRDEPKKRQRRISVKDCRPELALAKELKIPMILIVTNRINGQMWMYIVNADELKTWKGISTPVMLVKGDEGTGQELEEEFANNIVKLGGRA